MFNCEWQKQFTPLFDKNKFEMALIKPSSPSCLHYQVKITPYHTRVV